MKMTLNAKLYDHGGRANIAKFERKYLQIISLTLQSFAAANSNKCTACWQNIPTS